MNKNKFFNRFPFFIAEISGNHGGKITNAMKLILLAKKYGADAVKLQTYTADMMTLKKKEKIKGGLWKHENLWDLYNRAHTPLEWHKKLFDYAKKINIKIFSTPFSEESVTFLEKLNCPAYKISSFEMNDLNLIKAVAKTKKPIIISTGTFFLKEIDRTIKFAKNNGAKEIILLYCVSCYPSKDADFNLNNIKILKKKYNLQIGLSDHSKGSIISEYSIFMGAEVFEKHITLSNIKNAVDKEFSLKNIEIRNYKNKLERAFNFIKNKNFFRSKNELKNIYYRRSVYATTDIYPGEVFTKKNIKNLRPNKGLSADKYLCLLGKKSKTFIKKNTPIKQNQIKKI